MTWYFMLGLSCDSEITYALVISKMLHISSLVDLVALAVNAIMNIFE